jgi:caffeoyl-CoA O-methyltransferase
MSKFTALNDELHAYVVDHGARQDDVLRRVQEETAAMGDIARMQIAPDQGAFMTLLCRIVGASEAIELGTFTGYSAICIARGLAPGGRLVACELSEEYAGIASRNLEAAGVGDRVEIRIGPAIETLRAMPERELFDLAFIDADKESYPDYYEEVLPRMRTGGVVLIDNVLAGGYVASGNPERGVTERIEAIRRTNDLVAADDRVDCAMIAIADGLMIARKR